MAKQDELQELLSELYSIDKELYLIKGVAALLSWDKTVNLPPKAFSQRADQEALINVQAHELFTSKRVTALVNQLSQKKFYDKLSGIDKAKIDIYNWRLKKLLKVPKSHVEEYITATSIAHHAWEDARNKESFKILVPQLKKIFELKKLEAKYIDPKAHPYNIFLDDYERGMSMDELDKLFVELKKELLEILSKIKSSPNYKRINGRKIASMGDFPKDAQWELSYDMANRIVGDKDRLVISKSTHPFMTSISADDQRITTGVRNDPMFSFGSTVHESGHALYESNFDPKICGTILASDGALSLGMHESQSRFWENMICQSESFWKGYYPVFQSKFPALKKLPVKEFYESVNIAEPSLVRIESDELTYSIHIIIRYELERGLLDGRIKLEDLEVEWNKKYKEYLGIVPDTPSRGVLQDTHWNDGLIGYFPTYVLGNIYSAMIYSAIKKEHPQLEKDIEKLDFTYVRGWLKEHIHKYGASKTTKEIIKNACGKEPDMKDYIAYLKSKYYRIYGVKE